MAVTLLRAADHAWESALNGLTRLTQLHESGEDSADASMIASPFGNNQVGAVSLATAGNGMAIGSPNATSGGGTGGFTAQSLNIAAYIQLSAFNGQNFFGIGGTVGDTSSVLLCPNASSNKIEVRTSTDGLIGTGSVALTANGLYYLEILPDLAGSCLLNTYSVSGTIHTLIDSIQPTGDLTVGGGVTSLHSPSFLFGTGQTTNVGAVWITSGGFYTPGSIRGYELNVNAAGTYAEALWTPAGSDSPASLIEATRYGNCAAGTNAAYATSASGSGTGKMSLGIQTLASAGYRSGDPIYAMRAMNKVFMGATQATPTLKAGVIYNGTEYETTAMTSLVLLAPVVSGGVPHGRGIHYATNGPDSAALTEAKINNTQLMANRFADGTTTVNLDQMRLMVYAYSSPRPRHTQVFDMRKDRSRPLTVRLS